MSPTPPLVEEVLAGLDASGAIDPAAWSVDEPRPGEIVASNQFHIRCQSGLFDARLPLTVTWPAGGTLLTFGLSFPDAPVGTGAIEDALTNRLLEAALHTIVRNRQPHARPTRD